MCIMQVGLFFLGSMVWRRLDLGVKVAVEKAMKGSVKGAMKAARENWWMEQVEHPTITGGDDDGGSDKEYMRGG